MTTRTPAEVEAAMDAWFEMSDRYQSLLLPGERLFWPDRGAVAKMLQAADAIAAPAVGVTVEEAEALIDELLASLDGSADWEFDDEEEARYAAARNRIIALLTAQPEPGSDDAGQPVEGGV